MQKTTPELLSPAGGIDSAIAAINAGADAIYVGGKNFSARSSAQNFTAPEIVDLIEYAAVRRVKIYIAVNTLYKNDEIPRVLDFVDQMYRQGAAAFILQDPGLAYILKSHFPEIEVHASTQMTIHSTAGAKYMKDMGFSRVVLSRELSLNEVKEISNTSGIECEVFVHGALCVSYSGQCLMSSLIGGRSGNRGKCAQICRTKFNLLKDDLNEFPRKSTKSGYLLSPKDMMTLDVLNDITAAGVASLKIEGRMKGPEYVYLVTKAYRDKLDGITKTDTTQDLLQIFNRGGSFTTGYWQVPSQSDLSGMLSTVTPKSTGILVGHVDSYKAEKCKITFTHDMHPGDGIELWTTDGNHVGTGVSKQIAAGESHIFALNGSIQSGNKVYRSYEKRLIDDTKKAIASEKKITICGTIEAVVGQRLKLTLSMDNHTVEKIGDIVEAARSAPMSEKDIIGQLSKSGNMPFVINFTGCKIDDNIFVSKAALNQLRRSALQELEAAIIKNIKRHNIVHTKLAFNKALDNRTQSPIQHALSAQIDNVNHLPAIFACNIFRVYLGYTSDNIAALPSVLNLKGDTQLFVALPHISRNGAEADMCTTFSYLETTDIDGYLVSTYGQLKMLRSIGTKKQIVLTYTFNIFNNWAIEFFTKTGVDVTLSQELNIHEIKAMDTRNFELVVYGRQTLMSTHICPVGCAQNGKHQLRDKMGMTFPIKTDCTNCTAHILNCKTLDTASKFQAIKDIGAKRLRLIFTDENEKTIINTIDRYKAAIAGAAAPKPLEGTTYGHFYRGVE